MFKICLKVDCSPIYLSDCSLIYLSAQLKKSPFILKAVLLLNNERRDDKIYNNNGKLCQE